MTLLIDTFIWLGILIVVLGACYAFAMLVRDATDAIDNWRRIRRYGKCSRLGCKKAAMVVSGGNYLYCEKHAEYVGWSS